MVVRFVSALIATGMPLVAASGTSSVDTLAAPAFVRDVLLQQQNDSSCKVPSSSIPSVTVTKDFLSAQERLPFQGLATIPTAHKNRFRGKVPLPPFLMDRIGISKTKNTVIAQTSLITGTTPRHVDCMMPDDQGDHMQAMKGEDETMFVFLNTNEQAVFVVGNVEVPINAGTMVRFKGKMPHNTVFLKEDGEESEGGGFVELLGPFNAATLQRVEMMVVIYYFLLISFHPSWRVRRNLMMESSSAIEGCSLPEGNDDLMQQVSASQIRSLYGHFENKEDFSTDELLSIYLSYLSEEEASDAIASIDTNQDGIIDQDEIENMSIPDDVVEFIFTDVLACAAENSNGEGEQEDCMTAQAAIDFLNSMFGHEVVDADLAAHIKESGGADACFTREEFRSYASPGSDSKQEEEEQSKNGSSAPFFGMHLALLFFCLATSAAAVLFGL